jgi:4-hydroxy-2-oxoglutarate aldolase
VNLRGIFPPIPTPFSGDASDAVDHRALAGNIEKWMRTPLAGLVVLGSNGEAPLLDDDEADAVLATARRHIPSDRPMIAGTGRESTPATIAATKRAARLGADFALVRTPSYFKNLMTSEAFVRHFTAVADASPIPVLLYNVTVYTGVNLLPEAVERLAGHANIAGMKESTSDVAQVAELVARAPDLRDPQRHFLPASPPAHLAQCWRSPPWFPTFASTFSSWSSASATRRRSRCSETSCRSQSFLAPCTGCPA